VWTWSGTAARLRRSLRPEPREYDAVEEEGEDHEPPEDSHHDEEAPARTDPLPMSGDRDALPFPVYGRLRMGHRARGGWSRGVGDREDRQQTPHRQSQDGSNHEPSPIALEKVALLDTEK